MGLFSSLLKVTHLFASTLWNYPARIAESSSPTGTIKTTVCQYRTGTIRRLQFYFPFLLENLTISISIHTQARTRGRQLFQFTFYKDLLDKVITQVSSWHKPTQMSLFLSFPVLQPTFKWPHVTGWEQAVLSSPKIRERLPGCQHLGLWFGPCLFFHFGTTHLASVSWYTLKRRY